MELASLRALAGGVLCQQPSLLQVCEQTGCAGRDTLRGANCVQYSKAAVRAASHTIRQQTERRQRLTAKTSRLTSWSGLLAQKTVAGSVVKGNPFDAPLKLNLVHRRAP